MLLRSSGYEPDDFTTCPLCNNVSGERYRPSPSTAQNLRPVGYARKKDGKEKVRTAFFSNSDTNTKDKAKNPYIPCSRVSYSHYYACVFASSPRPHPLDKSISATALSRMWNQDLVRQMGIEPMMFLVQRFLRPFRLSLAAALSHIVR